MSFIAPDNRLFTVSLKSDSTSLELLLLLRNAVVTQRAITGSTTALDFESVTARYVSQINETKVFGNSLSMS